jgi:hypothetical protein
VHCGMITHLRTFVGLTLTKNCVYWFTTYIFIIATAIY